MKFKQTCMMCKKNKIEGGSDIEANIFTQYRAFVKMAEVKGWHVLKFGLNGADFICPFCDKRIMKELRKRNVEYGD